MAATIFPLLVAIYRLYDEGDEPTKFGKGLFMGMAYVAGAGSIITLLGAARGAVALGFYKEITGIDVTFFELTWYMAPIGWVMVFVLWGFFMVYYKPERASIPGLRERATRSLLPTRADHRQGDPGRCHRRHRGRDHESAIVHPRSEGGRQERHHHARDGAFLCLQDPRHQGPRGRPVEHHPALRRRHESRLLPGTDRGSGLDGHQRRRPAQGRRRPTVFILGVTFFVLIMTNLIMNVAAIAICLPVALKIAPYLGVGGEVILFGALVAAGMPFLLLVGAAPNAIAYESKQFTSGEFFKAGIPASLILMVVVTIFVIFIWPVMGMEVTIPTP